MDNFVKERILETANRIINDKGLNSFTLEEVAKEAGISKGGLLYHYQSKDKLMIGLIENHLELFQRKVSEREKNFFTDSPNNSFAAYIQEQFNMANVDSNTMSGIIAAFALNQDLLQPVLKKRKEWSEKLNELKDPVLGIIISLACDGIALSNLLGLDRFDDETKAKVMERLIDLTKKCY
jgi:AcrR family transcriptional regulator